METVMTVDFLCDHFDIEGLQEATRAIDRDAVAHDIHWYTISERATTMRTIRNNLIEALTIKKMTNITAAKAEKAGQQ
jgi:hypothetical protein